MKKILFAAMLLASALAMTGCQQPTDKEPEPEPDYSQPDWNDSPEDDPWKYPEGWGRE